MSETPAIDSNLCLKSVYELLNEDFFIPAYQRGYRWGETQVKALLSDILEFAKAPQKEPSAFYCLQPIVVVRGKDNWHVVDGQQRLTTLYLILRYLEQVHLKDTLENCYSKSLFSLAYETRPNCADFLKQIHEDGFEDNIDYFHMHQAYQTIRHWFRDEGRNRHDEAHVLRVLLETSENLHAVKVIWYDLTGESAGQGYAIDVFARINIGKIPLTNAELIKALFLKQSHFKSEEAKLKQLQIASEWDAIEKRLQEPPFWYFINDSSKPYPTRIEYIFDLMKGNKQGNDAFYTFTQFQDDLYENGKSIDELWKEVKDYFLSFEDWYQDRELYHLIGFLVQSNLSVARLKEFSAEQRMTKTELKGFLRALITKDLPEDIENLNYEDHRMEIRQLLLLFNIQTLLSTKNADVRFPFDRFKHEQWDIEHIRSRGEHAPKGKERTKWLDELAHFLRNDPSALTFFLPQGELSKSAQHQQAAIEAAIEAADKQISQLLSEVESFQNDDFLGHSFDDFFESVNEKLHQQPVDWIDDLGNLALLDSSTNRSYKNALFPIKRARIIDSDSRGVFVPICTKNAFLKYYSKAYTEQAHWNEADANDYVNALKQMLADYLPEQGASND
ncbi:DUF262 domain-containing HNH endonuclease family protein [Shewanella sp. SM20]|uniref:DUF262 domain-containing HNH endonuclease family protein n=1 Tax=Shewanella TaxID=22 RepID=UPI0021D915C8|nr:MULTISPECIES: DUF262 domain-containing HNH endonuclease family protein [unclassified Shewanella]MCU8071372.1 DUF262 domain-containing HNH endonuclease family protein [Shewanella sp. SM32]MCU8094198.1 DUF262 domain-containing HNH endonuclease family protein [Shewanella sp. SM20]